MIRLVVTGGREYRDEAMVRWALDTLHQRDGIELLIQGDADGADHLCKMWAQANGVARKDCPSAWSDITVPGAVIRQRRDGSSYNVVAGHMRNREMIDLYHPNYAVAFPGGSGTNDMVKRIVAAGITLWDLRGV